jgi:hypothetical protein
MGHCRLADIVRPHRWPGYPAPYLAVRVKGRHAQLMTQWSAIAATRVAGGLTDELVWSALLGDFAWLHRQMEPAMLGRTAPLFGLFELKTLVLALRNVAGHRGSVLDSLLASSLLAAPVVNALRRAREVATALDALAAPAIPARCVFRELPALYASGGLRALEDGVVRAYLEAIGTSRLHPILRHFFRRLIDLRNIVLAYKHLRWGVTEGCRFIQGGSVDTDRLQRILDRSDAAALDALIAGLVRRRLPAAATDATLEALLLQSITAALARRRREEDATAVVVSFMWRRYIHARNLAVMVHAQDVQSTWLARELIT